MGSNRILFRFSRGEENAEDLEGLPRYQESMIGVSSTKMTSPASTDCSSESMRMRKRVADDVVEFSLRCVAFADPWRLSRV